MAAGMLQRISGTVVTGASAGNLTMQFAEKTADANTVAMLVLLCHQPVEKAANAAICANSRC